MRAEQKPIAAWIEAVLAEKGWTAYRWAKATNGKVNPTTITRAVSPAYEGVTSIRILADLAEAAGVDMPVLAVSTTSFPISAAVLAQILPVVLDLMGLPTPAPSHLLDGAALLQSALAFLAVEPEAATDPLRARLATRALASAYGTSAA